MYDIVIPTMAGIQMREAPSNHQTRIMVGGTIAQATTHVEAMGDVINGAGRQLRRDAQHLLQNVISLSGRITDTTRRLGGIKICNATAQELAAAAEEAAKQAEAAKPGQIIVTTVPEKGTPTVRTFTPDTGQAPTPPAKQK